MTIEQRRHAELLSRLDALCDAVVALCKAITAKAVEETDEDEEPGCEAVRPIRVYDPARDETADVEMEEEET